MRGLFQQEIDFPGLLLVLLLGELRLLLAFCLEDFALPGCVTSILPMKKAIQLGGMLLAFLTMLVFGLEALFIPWLTVLVRGSKLRPGDVVGGFCALAVLDKGPNVFGLRIETLRNQHCLVGSRRLVGERVN